MKKIYLKVYQDIKSTKGSFYVDTVENVISMLPEFISDLKEQSIELPPIFEPVEMGEEDFLNLPDFAGF